MTKISIQSSMAGIIILVVLQMNQDQEYTAIQKESILISKHSMTRKKIMLYQISFRCHKNHLSTMIASWKCKKNHLLKCNMKSATFKIRSRCLKIILRTPQLLKEYTISKRLLVLRIKKTFRYSSSVIQSLLKVQIDQTKIWIHLQISPSDLKRTFKQTSRSIKFQIKFTQKNLNRSRILKRNFKKNSIQIEFRV